MSRIFTISLLLSGALALTFSWWKLTVNYTQIESDFTQDYIAAKSLTLGKSIYGNTITELAKSFLPNSDILNFHPPTSVIFYIPFSFLDYENAVFLWSAFSLILSISTVIILSREFGFSRLVQYSLLISILLSWPFIFNTGSLQSGSLLSFFLALSFSSDKRSRESRSGFFASLASLFKLFPLLFIFHFITWKKKRSIASLVMTLLIFSLLSITLVGNDFFHYFLSVTTNNVAEWSTFPINVSIRGLVTPLFTPNSYVSPIQDDPTTLTIIYCSLVCIYTIFLISSLLLLKRAGNREASFSIILPSMLLLSPIAWSHTFLVLLPALFVLLREYLKRNLNNLQKYLFWFVIFSYVTPDIYIFRYLQTVFSPLSVPWYIYLLTKPGPWCLLFLSILLRSLASGKYTKIPSS